MCRLSLVALGVLPLLLCVLFLFLSRTSWYRLERAAYWRERIRSNMGLDVAFSSIDILSPDRFVIHDLVCFHPETQNHVLFAERVHGMMASNGWALTLVGAELQKGQSEQAIQIIHDSFLCRPHKPVSLLKLYLPELRIKDSFATTPSAQSTDLPHLIYRVEVEYSPSLQKSELKIRFGLRQDARDEPVGIAAIRHHDKDNPNTEWGLDTGKNDLPCSLVSKHLPVLQNIGTQAMFSGKVDCSSAQSRWSIAGSVRRIDWGLLTSHIGSPIKGEGSIEIRRARILGQRLELFEGELQGGQSMQYRWLASAPIPLQLVDSPPFQGNEKELFVNAMRMIVRVDARGIHSQGAIGDDVQGYRVGAIVQDRSLSTTLHTIPFESFFDWMAKSRARYESEELMKIHRNQLQASMANLLPLAGVGSPMIRLSESNNASR